MNNFSIELAQQMSASTPSPLTPQKLDLIRAALSSVPGAEVDALLLQQLQKYHPELCEVIKAANALLNGDTETDRSHNEMRLTRQMSADLSILTK